MTWRKPLAVCLALALLVPIYVREPRQARNTSGQVNLTQLPLPKGGRHGPFTLAGAWELTSRDYRFGSYSGLVIEPGGRLAAFSDQGVLLQFTKPGGGGGAPLISDFLRASLPIKQLRDVEAATRDPVSGKVWLALEGRNAVIRLDRAYRIEQIASPAALQGWSHNSGPEAMTRLADGRFVALSESYSASSDWSGHPAVLFAGDPTVAGTPSVAFRLEAANGYRPTDAAQLPDGRVLVLLRRLVWPLPPRFAVKLALFDPAEIAAGKTVVAQEVAAIEAPWPVDNYEALALESERDGAISAWIMSDGNSAITQRNLLLRLRFDPADLPDKTKGAQVAPRAPR